MKRFALCVVLLVGALFLAGQTFGWDIPSKVPTSAGDVKDVAGTKGLETALNQKLKNANCKFVPGTTQVTGCDLKKIGQELAAVYRGAKESANYRVYINIEAADAMTSGKKAKMANLPSAYERTDKVKADLRSGLGGLADSWAYNTSKMSTPSDNLSLKVTVEK